MVQSPCHPFRRPVAVAVRLLVLVALTALVVPAAFAQAPGGSPREVPVEEPERPSTELERRVDRPFAHLFRNLGQDLGRLGSRENAVLVGSAVVAAIAGRPNDRSATASLAGSSTLDVTFEAGEFLGGSLAQAGGAVATYALGRVARSARTTAVGSDLIRAQVLNAVLTQSIKLGVRRARPDGGVYSFPSGHASGTFASAAVLHRHFGWRVGLPAYGIAAYVATSRLQENRHFLSDVLVGAAIGLVAGRTVTVELGRRRFAVTPLVTPRGGGVAFVALPPGG